MPQWTNWTGFISCSPRAIHHPETVEELVELVSDHQGPFRVAGAGHAYSPLVETDDELIVMDRMTGLVGIDRENLTAEFQAGTSLEDAAEALRAEGLCFHIEADNNQVSLGGAVSAGLHGSGAQLGSLASMVTELVLVRADGEILTISRRENAELFNAVRVSFGALGILVKITLAVRVLYNVVQKDWCMSLSDCARTIEGLRENNRIFELFWMVHCGELMCRSLNRTYEDAADEGKGSSILSSAGTFGMTDWKFAGDTMSLMPFMSEKMHRKITKRHSGQLPPREARGAYDLPVPGKYNEMEFGVPVERGLDCLMELSTLLRETYRNRVIPLRLTHVAADDIWLSPFYMRDSACIAVWQPAEQTDMDLFHACERIFHKHSGRPHWGKIHDLTPRDLSFVYTKWVDFINLRKEMDPTGKFLSPYVRHILGIDGKSHRPPKDGHGEAEAGGPERKR